MKPVDQTLLHDPANGVHGDCFRAVVASLLELPIESVPHFAADFPEAYTAHKRINAWLRPFGLAYINLGVTGRFLDSVGIAGLHHELQGDSPRGHNAGHCVVAVDCQAVHDPHPDRSGVISVNGIGLFVCLDPSKWRRA
jgi:hypothetical protein